MASYLASYIKAFLILFGLIEPLVHLCCGDGWALKMVVAPSSSSYLIRWWATLLLNSSSCLKVHAYHGGNHDEEEEDHHDDCLILEVKADTVWVFSDCALEHLEEFHHQLKQHVRG